MSALFGLLRAAVPVLGGFFTGGLSWLWGALSLAWGTEIGRTAIIACGCGFGGFFWGFSHEHAVKERAVAMAVEQTTASRDAEWSSKLEQANAQVESRVQMAIAAAKAVPSTTPLSDDDLVRLCAKSASCRDRLEARRRVQSHPMPNVDAKRLPADNLGIGSLLGR
jgi:hypothetical protein